MSSEQARGAVARSLSAEGMAMLISAAGDGLMLHALVDPQRAVREACRALRALIGRETKSNR